MTYPPLPDLSAFDFDYVPTHELVEDNFIEDEESEDRVCIVASIFLAYSMLGDTLSVCVKNEDKNCTYYFANETAQLTDDELVDKKEELGHLMSFGEFLRYLEDYKSTNSVIEASVGVYMYECLDDLMMWPVDDISEVEVESEIYPQLEEFYVVLKKYLLDWLRELEALPSLEEFINCIRHLVDSLPKDIKLK
ncbi:MAG: hypothetical protein ACK45R_06460 [Candidatus Kapaibacterium sp.]|jgi:hypothetical protein